jgi:2-oxoglutarate ferredoxin oxidoreductase subunit alpha
MVEDVKLAACGQKPVYFFGRLGGIVPTPQEVFDAIKSHI